MRVFIYEVPKSDPDIVYIGLNDRDKAWHDLYKLRISTGEKTLIRKNTERITGWQFDLRGQLRLAPAALKTETPRFSASMPTSLHRSTPAPSLKLAIRCASARTTIVPTS